MAPEAWNAGAAAGRLQLPHLGEDLFDDYVWKAELPSKDRRRRISHRDEIIADDPVRGYKRAGLDTAPEKAFRF